MQSGITVSKELHDAFNRFVSSSDQRGLIATIDAETVKPQQSVPSTSADFSSDLSSLKPLLSEKQAAYIILRRYEDAPDGYVAVTFVPDAAPVRQKMLFASTRLALVRELGSERFRETLFATELAELDKEGWKRHDESGATQAPLTEEEETLKGVKDAEADARGGTAGRRLETGGKLSMPISDTARSALTDLKDAAGGTLVQLRIDIQNESFELVNTTVTSVDGLGSEISNTEPRYSLFKYRHSLGGSEQNPLLFIYSAPDGLGVRARMLYATSKAGFLAALDRDIGLDIAKKFEVTNASEIDTSSLSNEFGPKEESKPAFSRPKRPGKR